MKIPNLAHKRFLLLLGLFVLAALIHSFNLPVMEGSDENLHTNYVEYLLRENELPNRFERRTNGIGQASGQPPLPYWLISLPLRALNLPTVDPPAVLRDLEQVENRWHWPRDLWNPRDNKNIYIHGREESVFSQPTLVMVNRAMRWVILVMGAVAVVGAYGAAREVFRDERWALTAAALFAFTPTMIHASAYVTNDTAVIAFSTLAIWQTMRLLRLGHQPKLSVLDSGLKPTVQEAASLGLRIDTKPTVWNRVSVGGFSNTGLGATTGRLILIGVLLALTGLSKVNGLLIAPGIGLALLFESHNSSSGWKGLLRNSVLIGLPFALIFGPWVLYGALNYGDPLGIGTHQYEGLGFYSPTPRPIADTLEDVPDVYLSYWGKFLHVLLEPSSYHAFGLILALVAAGYIMRLRDFVSPSERAQRAAPLQSPTLSSPRHLARHKLAVQQGLVLAVMIVLLAAGLFRWMQQLRVVGARLIYPGHIAVAIGITAGLYLLSRHSPRLGLIVRAYSAGVVMAAGLLLSPLALLRAYGPPAMLTRDQLPPLQGQPIEYEGIIRFLGYHQESPLFQGRQHTVTLCWEVLQATDRPAAFSIKYLRDSPVIADRTSLHGMGHYPSPMWQPGDIFCDDVSARIDDPDLLDEEPPASAYIYDMVLVLLDAETMDVNWQAARPDGTPLQFPVIGQVISPAGDLSASLSGKTTQTRITFPGLANLHSYALSGEVTPGAALDLTLLWDATGQTPDDWTQFIHLTGSSEAVVLADGTPRQGDYPTWAWSNGERIVDQWHLVIPDTLPAGDYNLQIGFYRKDSGERIPATQDGTTVSSGAPVLAAFHIE